MTSRVPIQEIKSDNRVCGTCTACCDGWLVSEVLDMRPGQPCRHRTIEGCAIYEERPEKPCRTFSCSWLTEDFPLPESARPDQSGVILSRLGNWGLWPVLAATPTGAKFDPPTFDFLKSFCTQNNVAILCVELEMIDESFTGRGWQKTFGPEDFVSALRSGDNVDALWELGNRVGRV